ncbi:unnamed protein product [Urochloa humidicola]
MDAGETHYSQADVPRASKAKFDEQLSRVYTRAVYKEYKTQFLNSTAFVIEPNPDPTVHNGYLVKHETGAGSFCWAKHEFKVIADKESGEYSCECKQWDHTGLFCMHIIKAFAHLQVRTIPKKYILKRYTRDAASDVHWDRHDTVRIGKEASKENARLSKLIPKLMRLERAGSKSDEAYIETNRQLEKITPGIEMFQKGTDDESAGHVATETATGAVEEIGIESPPSSDPSSAVLHEGIMLLEPPMARTKGRKASSQNKDVVQPQVDGNPLSTYKKKNYGNKECHCCGVRGTHYSTTCPLNPNRSKVAETCANNKRGAKTQGGPAKKRGRSRIMRDVDEESDEVVVPEVVAASQPRSAKGRGTSTRGRGARAGRVNYQE